jgi:RNA polymerase sigma-70 factor (ECF subfamily)
MRSKSPDIRCKIRLSFRGAAPYVPETVVYRVSPMSNSLDRWFAEEVLVHEESLMKFLARSWSNRSELDDIRQEAYVRVYEAAAKARPQATKSFLFTTARHLMIDRVRRQRIVSIEAIGGLGELDDLNVLIDEPSSEARASASQELRRLATAFDALPARCREVLWLRRVEDLPQKEVARRLGTTEKAVERALARGVDLLAGTVLAWNIGGTKQTERENEHGKCQSD